MTETIQTQHTTRPLDEIREALMDVIDPELGVNIVDLGLLYGLEYDE